MSYIIKIPKLGLTMTEGTVNEWFKKEGESVKVGDVILEIATDKLVNEIEAEEDGVIRKIFIEEGESKPVSSAIAIVAKEDEDISKLLESIKDSDIEKSDDTWEQIEPENSTEVEKNDNTDNEIILASPLAKQIAKEKDIDLSNVSGTGIRNMVTSKDLDKIKIAKASPLALKMISDNRIDISEIKADGKVMENDVLRYLEKTKVTSSNNNIHVKKEKATPMRKAIARNMSYSFINSPRVTFNIDVDATQLKELKKSFQKIVQPMNLKLTYNHIIMKVCAKALIEFPYINSQFDGEEITIFPYANIGLAIGLDNGLVVPNIKNVDSKNLLQVAKETEEMILRGKSLTLTEEESTGGTFTITNIGKYGITSFTPIINQPEVSILGINQLIDKPVVSDGNIEIKPILSLSLTADHRLIDGVYAAKFLARIKELLENPILLLI